MELTISNCPNRSELELQERDDLAAAAGSLTAVLLGALMWGLLALAVIF